MGKLSNSWDLARQSFQVLKSDKELMWLPVLSAISCLLATALMMGAGAVFYPSIRAAIATHSEWRLTPQFIFGVSFAFYLVNYFVIVFLNTALVGAATIRLQGGDPAVDDGLRLAWQRKGVILQWAFVAATVGMILKMIEERASFIGRLVVGLIGLAWSLASFLVAPILAYEDVGPFEALQRSAELFRKTWGEQVVGGISFGLIFFLLAVPGLLLPIFGYVLADQEGLIAFMVPLVFYVIILSVENSATRGIFVAALYHFATTGRVAPGFRKYSFANAWKPRDAW